MKNLIYLALLIIILSACETPQFSQENPFAVMAKKYRNPIDAVLAKDRLEDMGLKPYLIYFEIEDEGRWHGVFLGAFPTLESMMKGKIDYEDDYGLKQIERINFHQISGSFLPFNYNKIEWKKPEQPLPLPQNIQEITQILPYKPELSLSRLCIIDSLSGNTYLASKATSFKFDFPRGIAPIQVFRKTQSVVEAIYKDEFTGQHFTLQLIKLADSTGFADDNTQYFADAILNTREYKEQEASDYTQGGWKGKIISLSPKEEQMRNYIVLTDQTQQWLIFAQSREKFYPLEELKAFCGKLGSEENISSFHYVYQNLASLPKGNDLVAMALRKIDAKKSRYEARWKGNIQADLWFNNPEKGIWKASQINFTDKANASYLYQKAYVDISRRIKPDTLSVNGNKALLLLAKRRERNGRKTITFPQEAIWQEKQSIRTLSNLRNSWLESTDFEQKAKSW